MALCGVESINMLTSAIENLGIYCSCNKTLKNVFRSYSKNSKNLEIYWKCSIYKYMKSGSSWENSNL